MLARDLGMLYNIRILLYIHLATHMEEREDTKTYMRLCVVRHTLEFVIIDKPNVVL